MESLVTPFMLQEDGLGWLYVPSGLQDGPMLHITNRSSHRCTTRFTRATRIRLCIGLPAGKSIRAPGDPRFPFVLTTYRLTEHHTAGGCRAIYRTSPNCSRSYSPKCPRACSGVENRQWRPHFDREFTRSNRSAHSSAAVSGHCISTGKPYTKSRCRFISVRPDR